MQARELTGLQSILQNQVDKFGQHFFKEGAKVIPGNTAYTQNYHAIEVNNTHLGFPVDFYIEQLYERKIVGLQSGVTAIIDKIIKSADSEHGNLTLYISYISTGSVEGNEVKEFQDGELLTADTDILTGPQNNPFIPSGESFASCIATGAASKGSAFSISNGVYFIRGNFVNVEDETIVISQYDNNASCRVGLKVIEEIVNSDEDETLTDNSKGFNNYSAPGADRLRIRCALFSKPLDDFNDANFVELAEIREGVLRSQHKTTQYGMIGDELARRTYEESGDYTVSAFSVAAKESLNNGLGNNGVYDEGEFSYQGKLASEDLAQYAISPGKAFVKGYEVETLSTTYLDCPKPRTSKTLHHQGINYNTGRQLEVNAVYGLPEVGIGNTYIVSLRDQKIGSTRKDANGTEIGVARVYDHSLNGGSFNNVTKDANMWDLTLYDVQTFTKVTLNQATTLSVPTFVKGKYSGATAFLQSAVTSSTSLVLYQTEGKFVPNEPFIFDGIEDSRVSVAITSYGLENVKSVYGGPDLGNVGFARTFNGDTIQDEVFVVGEAKVGARDQEYGISVITATNPFFPGEIINVNDLLTFSGSIANSTVGSGNTVSTVRVTGVSTNYISVTGIATVNGVYDGFIPQVGVATVTVPDLKLIQTKMGGELDNTLYTPMPRKLVSNVDLTDASLVIRKPFPVVINATTNELSETVTAGPNETFQPFRNDRYTLIRADGTYEILTDDKFTFTNSNNKLLISNIGVDLSNNEDATLVVTILKSKPTAKVKRKNKVNTVVINKSNLVGSGVGATTLNDGLSYGNFPYGTRVQDDEISLNTGDIIKIHGVFESADTSEATAPKITLASITGPSGKTSDLSVGEDIVGATSGAIAIYAEKVNDTQISYITKNNIEFISGEKLTFKDSKLEAIVSVLTIGSPNVSSNFTFNSGQKGTYYNYGSIIRKANARKPVKSLKIYFANGYYESSDKGDITTKNSYDNLHYIDDVMSINGIRNTDMIDIRPKVSNYTVAEDVRSPLEFYGRSFNADGNSAANILASDEVILTDMDYYVGRIDRIFLTKEGKFQIQYGDPGDKMVEPVVVDDALEIASVQLRPYMMDPQSGTKIEFLNHKRYRMSDIKKLEERIKNLEYYTNLSLLETNTANLFIPDANGFNSFKSGFFVDNFTTFLPQEDRVNIKNSIDIQNKELRPQHYTNSLDLMTGPVEGVADSEDRSFLQPEGTNIKKSGDVVTLDYTEVEWLKQSFATRAESITPFLVSFWQMSMELTPASDTWVDTARLEAKIIQTEGNYAQTMADNPSVDPQTGMGPMLWNSWETVWTGQEVSTVTRERTVSTTTRQDEINAGCSSRLGSGDWFRSNREQFLGMGPEIDRNNNTGRKRWNTGPHPIHHREPVNPWGSDSAARDRFTQAAVDGGLIDRQGPGGRSRSRLYLEVTTNQTIQETFREVVDVGTKSRTGQRTVITEQFDMESQGDKVVSREVIPIMRSRNIQFVAKKCKPLTRMYSFFDGVKVHKYTTPKLLEIKMTSGVFQVGERVVGHIAGGNIAGGEFRFRVAQSNHKEGPYNAPTSIFTNNPYTSQTAASSIESFLGTPGIVQLQGSATANNIPATYSSTSTILNVDCASLADQPQGDYFGYGDTGMVLTGQTSGAIAEITNKRLISDLGATLIGTFYIPDPNRAPNPTWETGEKVFTLIDNTTNDQDNTETIGEEKYTASGTLETVQENIISVRNARVEIKNETQTEAVQRQRGDGPGELIGSTVISTETSTKAVREWYDPLAQSYQVLDETGCFLTSCDVFFQTKDDMNIPMTFQLRTMKGGVPTQKILPFSEVIVPPDDISISQDGTVPTRVTFKAPVYMEPGMDYAITLASWSTKYKVFISRVGEADLVTDEFISQQPYLGSLFKSQNASTWDASQWEDLKFTLYRADFETEGTLELYNPVLSEGNAQIPVLQPNSINLNSRKVRVGLGTTLGRNIDLDFGNTIYQDGTEATGNYVANAGVATGSLAVINAGFGYTPASGVSTVVGVALSTITGNGKDATAVVTFLNGNVSGAAVSTSGYGYQVGDVVGITTGLGINCRMSIVSIASTNELILDNVQGDFATGVGKTMMYTSSVGVGTTMNGFGGNVLPTNIEIVDDNDTGYHDGQHFIVDHKNHGMYHETNYVTLSNIESDVVPTRLSSPYQSDSTSSISIDSSSNFGTFENVGVAVSNPGYIKIGDEVIKYTGTSGNTLTGITREQDTTVAENHLEGAFVHKYELGGVSLRRFNTTHNFEHVDDAVMNARGFAPISYDSYTLKLDFTSNTGVARTTSESFPILYVNDTKSAGGFKSRATQNMPFEIVSPMVHNITVPGTTVSAEMKTVTGTSLADGAGDGQDVPFAAEPWEGVTLNKSNYLDSPRLIASRINETSSHTGGHGSSSDITGAGQRSFNLRVKLNSTDSRLSPIIDTQRMNAILVSNRIDAPVMNYSGDTRTSNIFTDPHACQYVSKENILTNGATQIKILLSSHINVYSNIRAFYAISDAPNFSPQFIPFPGYMNLNTKGDMLMPERSDGRSDIFVPPNGSNGFDSSQLDFTEITFTAKDLPKFNTYRIKIVLSGMNQVYCPRVKNLRVITLA